MDLPPQLRQLRDFYYHSALTLPAEKNFIHAPALIDRPTFFTLEQLKAHLNSPTLMPSFFMLYWQGKPVDCSAAIAHKFVNEGMDLKFLNKAILEDYLSRGASLVLEGLDILNPTINAMCAAIDAARQGVFSNSVVFFSQRGGEAYRGHWDAQDVLVIHLAGEKRWRLHERQPPRLVDVNELPRDKMGKMQAEVTMRPGDALFLKAARRTRSRPWAITRCICPSTSAIARSAWTSRSTS
jgi:ribosomal protein L16 Arg81 hydroxylase